MENNRAIQEYSKNLKMHIRKVRNESVSNVFSSMDFFSFEYTISKEFLLETLGNHNGHEVTEFWINIHKVNEKGEKVEKEALVKSPSRGEYDLDSILAVTYLTSAMITKSALIKDEEITFIRDHLSKKIVVSLESQSSMCPVSELYSTYLSHVPQSAKDESHSEVSETPVMEDLSVSTQVNHTLQKEHEPVSKPVEIVPSYCDIKIPESLIEILRGSSSAYSNMTPTEIVMFLVSRECGSLQESNYYTPLPETPPKQFKSYMFGSVGSMRGISEDPRVRD